METLNERAGFLCNHEVLALLRQQRDARAQQIKHLTDSKKGKERDGSEFTARDEIERIQPQDLHTVTFEALSYLEEPVHPMRRQTTESVGKLLDELEELDLTKAERLQLVNLAPTSIVELHVCIEDIGERFPTDASQEHLLSLIKSHLSSTSSSDAAASASASAASAAAASAAAAAAREAADKMEVDEREAAAIADEEDFIAETFAGGRANEDVENDIDEERD
ncbi:hypothetical protein JCM6882_007762 [Rhodosporidiobolus microsporus]